MVLETRKALVVFHSVLLYDTSYLDVFTHRFVCLRDSYWSVCREEKIKVGALDWLNEMRV